MNGLEYAAVVTAVAVALSAPLLARRVLTRLGVFDVPNSRSSHAQPVLRGGGLAPLAALVAAVPLLVLTPDRGLVVASICVAACAAVVGLADDIRTLPVSVRLVAQAALGAGGGALLVTLTGSWWGWAAVVMVAVAAYINMVNFMDGINLISGLHGGVVGTAYAIAGAWTGTPSLTVGGALVAVVFLGFLPWNVLGSRMFLGDVGSYLLGAVLAMLAAGAIASGVHPIAVLAPLSVYITDTAITVVRRLLRGENILEAHRTHVYQRLFVSGWTHAHVATAVTAFSALAAFIGMLSLRASSPWVCLAGVLAVNVGYLALGESVFRVGASRKAHAA